MRSEHSKLPSKVISDEVNVAKLEWTGERYVPEVGGEIQLEHIHRYTLALPLVQNKQVLDIACGEGYGTSLLAERSANIIGVDCSSESIAHASKKYKNDNLTFLVGECKNIPAASGTIDVVVSYETIEHHSDHEEMMSEIKRVLKPDGCLIISSPDKLVYSDIPDYSNEYHVKELYKEEFVSLVNHYFDSIRLYSQKVVFGSIVIGEDCKTRFELYGKDSTINNTGYLPMAPYQIALCSNADLPNLSSSLYEVDVKQSDTSQQILEALSESQLIHAQTESYFSEQIRLQVQNADRISLDLSQKTEWAVNLSKELDNHQQLYSQLLDQYNERTAWAGSLSQELDNIKAQYEELYSQHEQRTKWAIELQDLLEKSQQELSDLSNKQ
jgi:2-polyprenyl-3-methyl-5-hydroxy-6-metoxy-1,4-benzoquinol methylase